MLVCACLSVLAGSGGPASRARFGAPHPFFWPLCLSALLGPLRAGVAPFLALPLFPLPSPHPLLIEFADPDRRKEIEVAFKLQIEDDSSTFMVLPSKHLSAHQKDGCSGRTCIISKCSCLITQTTPSTEALTFRERMICHARFPSAPMSISRFRVTLMTRLRTPLRYRPTPSPCKNTLVKVVGMLPITRKGGEGKRTTSPRSLQVCPDIHALRETHVTAISFRLHRRVAMNDTLVVPVDMVLPRLINNPDAGYYHACRALRTAVSTAGTLDVS